MLSLSLRLRSWSYYIWTMVISLHFPSAVFGEDVIFGPFIIRRWAVSFTENGGDCQSSFGRCHVSLLATSIPFQKNSYPESYDHLAAARLTVNRHCRRPWNPKA